MRPTVVVFSVLAFGALAAMGGLLFQLIGHRPAAARSNGTEEVSAPETSRSSAAAEPAAEAEPAAGAPRPVRPAWVARVQRAAPHFDKSVFERASSSEALRQQSRQDGFLYRTAGTDEVYVVQKGTRFRVSNLDELSKLGLKREQIVEVPPGSMDHLSDRPPERALLREDGDPRIFVFENGVKRWITDGSVFNRGGFDWGQVRVTPAGSLGAFDNGEPVR